MERVKNRIQLDQIIQQQFARMNCKDVLEKLDRANIAFGRVNEVSDLSSHPCLHERIVKNEYGKEVFLPRDPALVLLATSSSQEDDHKKKAVVPKIGHDTARIRKEFDI